MASDSKIALITGGSRGLGRSTALNLARKGVDVIITYNENAEAANAVVTEIQGLGRKAIALQLDTSTTAQFGSFTEKVASVLNENWDRENFDFLVNNAGIGLYGAFADVTEEQFDTLMNIHLKGVFFLTQKLLPLIADGGRIVNTSTGLTRFTLPGYSTYAIMKGGVEVLTRYLALELGPRGIAVNAIAPGATATDFGGGRLRDDADLNEHIAAQVAMGRVGLPDDIGGAVTSLLVGDNGWVTGQRIEASGGQSL